MNKEGKFVLKTSMTSIEQGLQKGFTLIELMIVVAIIAALAAFAVPAYQDHVVRTRVAEGLVLASVAKSGATEFYGNNGRHAINNAELGIPTSSQITGNAVRSISLSGAQITITYDEKVTPGGGAMLYLTMNPASVGSFVWTCTGASNMPERLLPSECR